MSIAFISTIPIWLLIFTASPFHNEVSILICSFTSWIEPRAVISILQLPFRLLLLFSSPFLRQSLFDGEVTIFFRCKDIMQRCRSIYGSLRSDQWHTRKSSDIFLLREKYSVFACYPWCRPIPAISDSIIKINCLTSKKYNYEESSRKFIRSNRFRW